MGIPPVATCDCHYVNREGNRAQDILLCVNTGRFRNDASPHEDGYNRVLSKSPSEMYERSRIRQAMCSMVPLGESEIADSVSIELELGKRHFPGFDLPSAAADELVTHLRPTVSLCTGGKAMARWTGRSSCRRIARLDRAGVIMRWGSRAIF